GVYLTLAAAVVVPTIAILRRLAPARAADRLAAVVYVVFLAYAVSMPRFRNYHYMLLIVPTYFVATRSTRLRQAIPLLLLACLPVYSWITSEANVTLLANYASWFIALGAWALCLNDLRAETLAPVAA